MKIEKIQKVILNDIVKLNEFIVKNLYSNIELITTVSNYLIQNSGKKLRPILMLLMLRALNCEIQEKHIKLACAIEYIHTATLLHDDVIDNSNVRRKQLTVNKKWDNKTAILVGDFLYSRAIQLITEVNNLNVLNIITTTTSFTAEGEILQLILQKKEIISEKECFTIIQNKTAKLFEAATVIAVVIFQNDNTIEDQNLVDNIKKYGYYFGIAYQLLNDTIDCDLSIEKNTKKYNDLQDGKLTIPILHCLRVCNITERNYIKFRLGKKIIKKEKEKIYNILKKRKSFLYIRKLIKIQISTALSFLEKISIKNIYINHLKTIAKSILKKVKK